jgi:hypothetical protein
MKETYSADIVQIYYKVNVRKVNTRTGENYGDIDLEEERKIFPELLTWFGPSWFSRNFPHNEEDLPKRVEPAQHFLTWDKKKGICLCVGYYIDQNIIYDTDDFKETLEKIIDDAEGQFSDGWGESLEQRDFKVGRTLYSPQAQSDVIAIVTPVALHGNFMAKWKSVDEIEHTDWMLAYDNDAFNICFNKAAHEKKLQECKFFAMDKKEVFEFIEKNKKHFFIAR